MGLTRGHGSALDGLSECCAICPMTGCFRGRVKVDMPEPALAISAAEGARAGVTDSVCLS